MRAAFLNRVGIYRADSTYEQVTSPLFARTVSSNLDSATRPTFEARPARRSVFFWRLPDGEVIAK